MTIVGLTLLLGWIGWEGESDKDGFQEDQELGVGLLTGGLIGSALLLIDERRESERDRHDAKLAADQMRHSLITALTMKDDLSGVVLSGQDLTGLVAAGRTLSGANLSRAILTKADLVDSDLSSANLKRATLRGANLEGADMSGANLERADFSALESDDGLDIDDDDIVWYQTKLGWANLTEANLDSADLTGANLEGADLSGANLKNANLTGSALGGVIYDEATRWPAGFNPPTNAGEFLPEAG